MRQKGPPVQPQRAHLPLTPEPHQGLLQPLRTPKLTDPIGFAFD